MHGIYKERVVQVSRRMPEYDHDLRQRGHACDIPGARKTPCTRSQNALPPRKGDELAGWSFLTNPITNFMRPNAQLRRAAQMLKEAEERQKHATLSFEEIHRREEEVRRRHEIIAMDASLIYQRDEFQKKRAACQDRIHVTQCWCWVILTLWTVIQAICLFQ